jgi:hypothetical protein
VSYPLVGVEADISHVVDMTVMGCPVKVSLFSQHRGLLDSSVGGTWDHPMVLPRVRVSNGLVSRHLTPFELSKAWYPPEHMVRQLPPSEVRQLIRQQTVPSKI